MKKMIKELMKINTRRGFRFENRKTYRRNPSRY